MSRKHDRPGQQANPLVVSSQPSGGVSEPATLPARFNGPGVAVVPAELMAQMQRRWSWFVFLAGFCMLLAVCSIVGWVLYIRASDSLTHVGTTAATAGANLQDMKDALAKAESRAASAEASAEARIAAAEQARKDADGKRDAAEKTKADAETRARTAEQAKSEAEAKLKTAEQARLAAETKVTQVQQSAVGFQETLRRLQVDATLYRHEMQAAREGERRAVQKLQDVLGEMVLADRRNPPLATAHPSPNAAQTTEMPPVAVIPSATKKPEPPTTQPVVAATEPADARTQALIPFRKDTALTRLEKPPEQPDPAVEAASPEKLLPWGEAMIVAGYPERGVTLIRKAVEKGARGPEYQKSLGWAMLRVGQPAEAKQALEAALVGHEDWDATSATATPDHWTAAFLLGRVKEEEFIRRWARDEKFDARLACLPWFYAGQKREIEGRRDEAISAYRVSVELGQTPNSYPIWRWAQQRLQDLEKAAPASQPAQ